MNRPGSSDLKFQLIHQSATGMILKYVTSTRRSVSTAFLLPQTPGLT